MPATKPTNKSLVKYMNKMVKHNLIKFMEKLRIIYTQELYVMNEIL